LGLIQKKKRRRRRFIKHDNRFDVVSVHCIRREDRLAVKDVVVLEIKSTNRKCTCSKHTGSVTKRHQRRIRRAVDFVSIKCPVSLNLSVIFHTQNRKVLSRREGVHSTQAVFQHISHVEFVFLDVDISSSDVSLCFDNEQVSCLSTNGVRVWKRVLQLRVRHVDVICVGSDPKLCTNDSTLRIRASLVQFNRICD
jgi:Holliday junction resolvase-like predicted endonuclease